MKLRGKIPEKDKQTMRRWHSQGASVSSLAHEFHCAKTTVYAALKLGPKPKKLSAEDVEQMRDWLRAGHEWLTVAENWQVSEQTAKRACGPKCKL
jgi:DNA invertase Pin-like site-specific DNA recombinase